MKPVYTNIQAPVQDSMNAGITGSGELKGTINSSCNSTKSFFITLICIVKKNKTINCCEMYLEIKQRVFSRCLYREKMFN